MIGSSSRHFRGERVDARVLYSYFFIQFLLLSTCLMSSVDAAPKEPKLVLRLFMVRHGQTLSNIENKVSGQVESPLTDLGEKQAFALGKSGRIPFPKFWGLYASDLERAQHTAKLIQEGAKTGASDAFPLDGQEFRLDRRLRELSKGPRQGFPKYFSTEEALQELKQLAAREGRTLSDADIPILESEKDGYARFAEWLSEAVREANQDYESRELANELSPLMVLVVSHSALLRAVLTTLFSKEELIARGAIYDTPNHLLIPNTSLTVVDITPTLNSDVWNRETPLSADDLASLWDAKLVELAQTGHYDSMA